MTMTEKFKILAKYIKDMSSETPDVETYISAGNNMGKYQLDIDIKSIAPVSYTHLTLPTIYSV